MGDKKNGRPRVTKRNKQSAMKKTVRVVVDNKHAKGSVVIKSTKNNEKATGSDQLIDIAAKQRLKVEKPDCRVLEIQTPPRDIKREIEMIEEKYYSSNAAVDRIMARKFRELVRIYVRRQVNRIKGRE